MRRVSRASVGTPPSLIGPRSPAAKELERAELHFANANSGKFKFKAYKQDDVVAALNELFHGKCAYCESSIKAVQPTDVEHFRPKGAVDECPGHRGYWWLAAVWENLLPSCIRCNRQNYEPGVELANAPLPHKMGGKFRFGKGDSFPILGAAHAADASANLDAEDPALIDPTGREPSDHLQWLEVGGKSLIGPRERNGQVDRYGLHTYQVFGLNRQGLVEDRTALRLRVQKGFVDVVALLEESVTTSDLASSDRLRERSFRMLDDLKSLAEPHQPYSAMVQELVSQEISRVQAAFQNLLP